MLTFQFKPCQITRIWYPYHTFCSHTEVNLKVQFCEVAKRIKVLHGRSCIFQIKYAFRCSVVTSMCVPSTWNCNLFWKYSDLPSKMLTFQSKPCQITRIWYPYHTFCFHTEVNLKVPFCEIAKITKVLHGRSWIFQIKYAFRCSVVTSMCAPPLRNHYFFWKSSDLPSKMLTFQAKSTQIPPDRSEN